MNPILGKNIIQDGRRRPFWKLGYQCFIDGVAYRVHQGMVLEVFRVKEFIYDINLMIWPFLDLQIQNGRRFSTHKGIFSCFSLELAFSVDHGMVLGVFRVKEFINDINLVMWPIIDLEIQNGRHFSTRKNTFFPQFELNSYRSLGL